MENLPPPSAQPGLSCTCQISLLFPSKITNILLTNFPLSSSSSSKSHGLCSCVDRDIEHDLSIKHWSHLSRNSLVSVSHQNIPCPSLTKYTDLPKATHPRVCIPSKFGLLAPLTRNHSVLLYQSANLLPTQRLEVSPNDTLALTLCTIQVPQGANPIHYSLSHPTAPL